MAYVLVDIVAKKWRRICWHRDKAKKWITSNTHVIAIIPTVLVARMVDGHLSDEVMFGGISKFARGSPDE